MFSGPLPKGIKMQKHIRLQTIQGEITIVLADKQSDGTYQAASVSSDWETNKVMEVEDTEFNAAMCALMSLVCNQASQGMDVESEPYLKALNDTLEDMGNKYPES